jgi:hypothetical protein
VSVCLSQLLSLSQEYLHTEFHTEHMENIIGWSEEFKILSLVDDMQKGKIASTI